MLNKELNIKIMNLRKNKPSKSYDIYIDRRSSLGNPFYMADESARDKVCTMYNRWFDNELTKHNIPFWTDLLLLKSIYETDRKLRLFCWCTPKRCHGETIKKWLVENIYA